MSLLFRGARPRVEERAVKLPQYLVNQMRAEISGVLTIDVDSAMRHDAVWSCVTGIAQDVSMMPVDVVRYDGGARRLVTPAPQIVAEPSVFVDALDWRYQILVSWLTAGNAWGLVTQTTPDLRYPTRIELQSAGSVRAEMRGSKVVFLVDNVVHELWPVGDLWHRPAYTMPGSMLGLSPIAYHAATIRTGLAAQEFGSGVFTSGGHPSALLSPEVDPGPEGARSLKESFMAATRGREPAVVPQSLKYTPIQISPDDSQFLDTQKYTVEQICRIFREDPADHGSAGSGSALTYANRSDADLARFKRRQFWVTKLQQVYSSLVPDPSVVRLNTSASLMMTARERHELHELRLNSKTTTVNEVRVIEDEAPFPGDEYSEPGVPGGFAPIPPKAAPPVKAAP